MLFENLLNAAVLMEVLDAVVQGRLHVDDYIMAIRSCPFEIPEA